MSFQPLALRSIQIGVATNHATVQMSIQDLTWARSIRPAKKRSAGVIVPTSDRMEMSRARVLMMETSLFHAARRRSLFW